MHTAICPFNRLSVFKVVTFNCAILSRLTKLSCVNFFLSPVMTNVAWGLPIRFISWMVFSGVGMFCSRVMAKILSKVLSGKGVLSASARIRIMLDSFLVRFFAFCRTFKDMSKPTRNLIDSSMCWKRNPVPHPKSRTSSYGLSSVLLNASSILEFCSPKYCTS